MTDPRADFLQTIIASPDDDTPRLVYADWLEEYGGEPERAKFIRIQCAIAPLEKEDGRPTEPMQLFGYQTRPCLELKQLDAFLGGNEHRNCELCLRRRERELLTEWRARWITSSIGNAAAARLIVNNRAWMEGSRSIVFRRGFVETITCAWRDWLTHHAAIMRVTPLREVALTTWPETTNVRGEWYYFNAEPEQRIHVEDLNGAGHDGDSLTQTMLRVRWPGIKFTLPPAITETPAEQLRRQRDDRLQNPRGRIIRDGFTLRLDG